MEEIKEKSKRNHETLYGNIKDILQQQCKSYCTKDSVNDALHEYEETPDKSWITSTKESHKGHAVPKREVIAGEINRACQDTTNFVLGFDEQKYIATTQDYKWHKIVDKPERATAVQTINIPDFCPSLSENKELNSIYKTSFAVDPDIERPRPKPHSERRKHTNDLRETHFKLGTWENAKTSETNHSLSFSKNVESSTKKCIKDTYASRVFRDGDWNRKERKLLSKSVTGKDFIQTDPKNISNGLTHDDQFIDSSYHRATHFNLGSVGNTNGSLYQKDYEKNCTFKIQEQLQPIPQFHSLNLFPSNQDAEYVSTNADSFQNNGKEKTIAIRKERMASLDEIKKYHCLDSIPYSCNTLTCSDECKVKKLSMTNSDFQKQFTIKRDSKVDIPTYDHLNGNYYGAETKTSEARENFVCHKNISQQVRNIRNQRRQDNKSTHFVFGTDGLDGKNSEQASQFRHHLPLDPSVRAAGKGLPKTKTYPHIFQNLNNEDNTEDNVNNNNSTSVMKDDYKDPKSSETDNSCVQKKSLAEYNFETHYFHMDHDYQGTQESTTRRDFISPVNKLNSFNNPVYVD